MNNTFSLQQISRTSNPDANLISRQYKLNLMAVFLRMKYKNPKLKQSEIANESDISSSTLQRYRSDMNMFSPYINKTNHTNKRAKKASITNSNNNSDREPDCKRLQTTSNDFKATQTSTKSIRKNKNIVKTGSVHENIEINDQYLDEILIKNKMEIAMQFISNDETVRSNTVKYLNEFNNQFVSNTS